MPNKVHKSGLKTVKPEEFKRIADDVTAWISLNCWRRKANSLRETSLLLEVKHLGATREVLREIMGQLGHQMGVGTDAKGNKVTIYHGVSLRAEAVRCRDYDRISDAQLFRVWRHHVFQGDVIKCAEFLGVGKRTIYNWEAGTTPISRSVQIIIHSLHSKREIEHAEANLSKPPRWLRKYVEASTSPGAKFDDIR